MPAKVLRMLFHITTRSLASRFSLQPACRRHPVIKHPSPITSKLHCAALFCNQDALSVESSAGRTTSPCDPFLAGSLKLAHSRLARTPEPRIACEVKNTLQRCFDCPQMSLTLSLSVDREATTHRSGASSRDRWRSQHSQRWCRPRGLVATVSPRDALLFEEVVRTCA